MDYNRTAQAGPSFPHRKIGLGSGYSDRGDESYWRRPGKTAGISGTLNFKGESGPVLFYVFTNLHRIRANSVATTWLERLLRR